MDIVCQNRELFSIVPKVVEILRSNFAFVTLENLIKWPEICFPLFQEFEQFFFIADSFITSAG